VLGPGLFKIFTGGNSDTRLSADSSTVPSADSAWPASTVIVEKPHHSRLWNRNITTKPMLPKRGEVAWCDSFIGNEDTRFKPFLLLAITRMLVKSICPNTQWHSRLAEHLERFPEQHCVC